MELEPAEDEPEGQEACSQAGSEADYQRIAAMLRKVGDVEAAKAYEAKIKQAPKPKDEAPDVKARRNFNAAAQHLS
eukprot:3962704-Alexandrium_andersonii.AAC.1